MRKLVLPLVVLSVVLTLGACADSPTQSDRAPDLPARDEQVVTPQGCVSDGLCVLPPISGGWCEPWMELDWDCDEGECLSTIGPGDPTTVQGCPGGGDPGGGYGGGYTPPPGGTGPGDPGTVCPTSGTCPEPQCEIDCPAEEEAGDTDICPQPLLGRTVTRLVNVAGRNHEFRFTGTMNRTNPLAGRSPAWYDISGPTASEDNWWIAQDGKIQLVCWGRWRWRNSVWVGKIYVQSTDLHMVMSAGHPDF